LLPPRQPFESSPPAQIRNTMICGRGGTPQFPGASEQVLLQGKVLHMAGSGELHEVRTTFGFGWISAGLGLHGAVGVLNGRLRGSLAPLVDATADRAIRDSECVRPAPLVERKQGAGEATESLAAGSRREQRDHRAAGRSTVLSSRACGSLPWQIQDPEPV